MHEPGQGDWVSAISVADLNERRKTVVKLNGKQILIWKVGDAIRACANRCPHEGFPLSEGSMSDDCVLTCNWHNWKFDLNSGETLLGGDTLRLFPVQVADGMIMLDVSELPAELVRTKALEGLSEAFDDHDYSRIARELARYERAEGAPLDALKHAFGQARDRLEYGTTHAQAGAADWLALRETIEPARTAERLIPVMEIIGHLAWDCLMDHGRFPYPQDVARSFDEAALEEAIEHEDEKRAIGLARWAILDGELPRLQSALERASLQHYQDFGHSPIYCDKSFELLSRFDGDAVEDVVLPLVRSFCMGTREDLIPEFRSYAAALESWNSDGDGVPEANAFRKAGVAACLDMIGRAGGRIEMLYDVLMQAVAEQMLHYDATYRVQNDRPVQDNIDWLDFTHAITHLNAVRRIAGRQPSLWPNGLLQTGCFLGRNTNYVDWDQAVSKWRVDDPDRFFDAIFDQLLDHGEPVYIFPVHVLKLTTAIREEVTRRPDAAFVPPLLAALNRFVNEPVKRKHARREAFQAMKFVEAQG